MTPALGRAFDMEVISCQRMVDISIPPYLKLAHAQIDTARGRSYPSQYWLKLLVFLSHFWSTLVIKILSTQLYLDSQRMVQPVIRPKRRAELLTAFLEAKFPEVRLLLVSLQLFSGA